MFDEPSVTEGRNLTLRFSDIKPDQGLRGVVAGTDVVALKLERHGADKATLVYRTAKGDLDERIIVRDDLEHIVPIPDWVPVFDADGASFRLASEARRMKFAHLADPFAAVETANIDPYPHQIEAVYNRLLPQRPLRFLLADDPGAGKTIMSGLLIRELMLRGDVARCLIVAPGALVDQWRDELWNKFGLDFELMSREHLWRSRSGNPFLDEDLLVARMDQLARGSDLLDKLSVTDWDLVIVDEAHKMAARRRDDSRLDKTKRFQLGERLRGLTRHFLLLTATPHNGKDEEFLAFMSLLDPERFAGTLRGNDLPDLSDVMRRYVKENLKTFEGKRLFPKRTASTLKFELSELEHKLYKAVTRYVTTEMSRVDELTAKGRRRKGIPAGWALQLLQRRLASSPAAIHISLQRRRERLNQRLRELRSLAGGDGPIPVADLPAGVRLADLEDIDDDSFTDRELEELGNELVSGATVAATIAELQNEVRKLSRLVRLANQVLESGVDAKWIELRRLLRSNSFRRRGGHRKLIIFSESKDTVDYLVERVSKELRNRDAVVTIHGGVRREHRREIQRRFFEEPAVQVLIATDAAGEGVNLQVANLMVNYDLPWNPNRIEQRFGRIHRIGQRRPCHLYNLVAHQTREGRVLERLLYKIERQRRVYGDQIYDVLGEAQVGRSLRNLIVSAVSRDSRVDHDEGIDESLDDIMAAITRAVKKNQLTLTPGSDVANSEVRTLVEQARVHKLQPYFVETFFSAALRDCGGRIVSDKKGWHEVTRLPASLRDRARYGFDWLHEGLGWVTFDKANIQETTSERAELISPGDPLLAALADQILEDHDWTLRRGATLVARDDWSTEPRLLVCLEHTVSDGRFEAGRHKAVSRQVQYVEITETHQITDPGAAPYLGYGAISENESELLSGRVDATWVNQQTIRAAQNWAIEHLAGPHYATVATRTRRRIAKVRAAVKERLEAESSYWYERAEDSRYWERQRVKPDVSSRVATSRAEDLQARLTQRLRELDVQEDLHNNPPTIMGAALVIPQGLLAAINGLDPPAGVTDRKETQRRGIEAVCKEERRLGREPTIQEHVNAGFDIESVDPETGRHYFIEVTSHLPKTREIRVPAQTVQMAKCNPERWRLAVAAVPKGQTRKPTVRYLVDPFRDVSLSFAQSNVTLKVSDLMERAGDPC